MKPTDAKKFAFILILSFLISVMALGASTKKDEEEESDGHPAGWDSFRCESARNIKLTDLKERLLKNCNLEKPFAITQTDIAVDSKYTFCCHIKK